MITEREKEVHRNASSFGIRESISQPYPLCDETVRACEQGLGFARLPAANAMLKFGPDRAPGTVAVAAAVVT